MNNNKDNFEKCEFILSIDNNIICQRYFNVKRFNKKALHSIDLYWVVLEIAEDIAHRLKIKTTTYLDYFAISNMTELPEEENYFTITIKHDTDLVMQRILRADFYPPKIRYTVDIRPQISYYLRELTDVLSQRQVIQNYQDYSLVSFA